MKKKKKISWFKKIGLTLLLMIVLVIGAVFGYVKMSTMPAVGTAAKISENGATDQNYLLFTNHQKNPLSVIFYPGALVAPESYSVWANHVAQAGYDVYIMKMPLNLAVFGQDVAAGIINEQPQQKFVLAGHSLGGVMASRFAASHLDDIAGVAFFASYPDEKGSLRDSKLPVLSLTASNDGVLNQSKYEEAKAFLPKETTYATIAGGNHAGFGQYGEQKGDNEAAITNEEQQKEIGTELTNWLIQLSM